MAYSMAVMGLPNSGKSFSRSFIKDASDCFVISPSKKFAHLFKNGVALPRFDFKVGEKTSKELANANSMTKHSLIKTMTVGKLPPGFTSEGNSVIINELDDIVTYLKFIDKHMPHIKNVWIGDFTHFISNIISSQRFIARKSGGEAFARFWDLAADALNNVFKSIEELEREDLLITTEFHVQVPDAPMEGNEIYYDVFLPAGKMLNKSFLPKSYYDICLCSHSEPYSDDIEDKDRFKFVVTRKEPYDGRAMGLFNDIAERGMIPNNMELVLSKVRKHYNI